MKAAANGALNVSVLDGWWAEAWNSHGWQVGWAIGRGEEYTDAAGDSIEAALLYDLLEREVVPLFFRREKNDRLPREWIKRMKHAIAKLVPMFNTARMVREYAERFYVPSVALSQHMMDHDLEAATTLAAWKQKVRDAWPEVNIREVALQSSQELTVGQKAVVTAVVQLGRLTPDDVAVELYHGPTNGGQELAHGEIVRMHVDGEVSKGVCRFTGEIVTKESGAHAFAARLMPWNAAMTHPYETSLIRWA
jgi:starch phosphorylase